jgi:hypothetical protein
MRASRILPFLVSTGLAALLVQCGESNSEIAGAPTTGTTSTSATTGGDIGTGVGPSTTATTATTSGPTGTGGSTGSGGSNGTGGSTGVGADAGCVPAPVPECDAAPPDPGTARPWHGSAPSGAAQHRGHDQFYVDGEAQWLIARFAYGLFDSPLVGEDIDVYLLRGCGSSWEKLGTAMTTKNAEHPAVEGVDDNGGRVYFEIPAGMTLGPGRHRVRFVVAGDLTSTELFIEHVPKGMPIFVSDIDGTLTTDETAEGLTAVTGMLPGANPDAAHALTTLASKGYRPFYLTARAAWRTQRTRDFLRVEGFPAGIIRTTESALGLSGADATTYKTNELSALATKGLHPAFGFGNSDVEAQAYHSDTIQNTIFVRYTDSAFNARRIEAYSELLSELDGLVPACP